MEHTMENRMECINMENGWTAVRTFDSCLTLHRHGKRAWEMEIPPKMPEAEWKSLAAMLGSLYDKAWADGWEACRRFLLEAAEAAGGEEDD